MKDLDALQYFLGIKVGYSSTGYLLSQFTYLKDIIKYADLTNDNS